MTLRMKHLLSKPLILISLSSSLLLSGCVAPSGGGGAYSRQQPYGGVTPQQATVIAGAVLGGVAGHQVGGGRGRTVATVLGAVLGGYLGGVMSNQSRQRTNYALDTNAPSTWVEPQTNNRYTVTPTRTYTGNVNGQQSVCRDYNMDAYIDGRLQQVRGRACRDANGQWVATR